MIAAVFVLAALHGSADAAELPRFRDCAACPEMIALPPGRFIMGAANERPESAPPVDVAIERPFALAVTETTFDQYRACVRAGGCAAEPDDHGWGRGNRPVIKVAWADALTYAEWLSRTSGHRYRLPSEAEWEYAARAGGFAHYPWGDDSGMARANCRGCGAKPWSGDRSAPAASFAPNGFGFFDLHGNVSEWVADCWAPSHRHHAGDQAPRVAGQGVDCAKRVTKGGDWYYIPALATSAARMGNDAGMTSYTIGFRVARDLSTALERDSTPQGDAKSTRR